MRLRKKNFTVKPKTTWLFALPVIAALVGVWYLARPDVRADVVRDYCVYYSTATDAQIKGCKKHVSYTRVANRAYRDSEAALCAMGWGDCFYDDEIIDLAEQPGFNKSRYEHTPHDLVRPDDGRQNPDGQSVHAKTP